MYIVRNTKEAIKMKTTYHRNGTVTFWSVYQQRWVSKARNISDSELAAMSEGERNKVAKHLGIEL